MSDRYDIVVIGGGILGASIAWDAALRGLRVALFEQKDFGGATTAATTKLIHGGLRYLQFGDIGLVRTSLRERQRLMTRFAHLVRPLPILLPITQDSSVSSWELGIGLRLYDWLAGSRMSRSQRLDSAACLERLPSLSATSLRGGFLYYDGQVRSPERLCLAVIQSAVRAGAKVHNYAHITQLLIRDRRVIGVGVSEGTPQHTREVLASVVVNATGPWADAITRLSHPGTSLPHAAVRGSHVVLSYAGPRLTTAVYAPTRDGRPVFFTPWRTMLLVGTTEITQSDPLTTPQASAEEVEYLIRAVRDYFPSLSTKMLYAYSGLRVLRAGGRSMHHTSRTHQLTHHDREGAAGMFSLLGGKMTTARAVAEDVVNTLCRFLGARAPCRTALTELDGALHDDAVSYQAHFSGTCPGLTREQTDELVTLYGSNAASVLHLGQRDTTLIRRLCPSNPDIAAQLDYGVQHEYVTTLEDFLLRRTGIGTSPCLGLDCCESIGKRLAGLLKWSPSRLKEEVASYRRVIARRQP